MRDVLLGAALVASFALMVVCTSWALDSDRKAIVPALLVAISALAIDGALLCLPWRRLRAPALLLFPLVLMAGAVALSLSTNGVASNYTGFFTLAFIYVGLTQDRVVVPALAVIAAVSWLVCQEDLNASTLIKLGIGSTIWVSVGWVLARAPRATGRRHASSSRRRTPTC